MASKNRTNLLGELRRLQSWGKGSHNGRAVSTVRAWTNDEADRVIGSILGRRRSATRLTRLIRCTKRTSKHRSVTSVAKSFVGSIYCIQCHEIISFASS